MSERPNATDRHASKLAHLTNTYVRTRTRTWQTLFQEERTYLFMLGQESRHALIKFTCSSASDEKPAKNTYMHIYYAIELGEVANLVMIVGEFWPAKRGS